MNSEYKWVFFTWIFILKFRYIKWQKSIWVWKLDTYRIDEKDAE